MKKCNEFLYKNVMKILIIYLFLQPLIDMFTAISLNVFNNSFIIGLIIRFGFLLYIIYYSLFLSKYKNKYITMYIVITFIYLVLFSINVLCIKGMNSFFYEMKNTFKAFYFPILLVSCISIFKNNRKLLDFDIFKKLFYIYTLGVIIPNILGIGFSSYAVTKTGNIGFFYTANEIGAILSILMIFFINDLYKKGKYIKLLLSMFVILYMFTFIGTKGPLILFIILILYYLVKYFKSLYKEKKYGFLSGVSLLFIMFLSLFILFIPRTNFYKNIVVHLDYLKVDSIDDIFTNEKIFDHFIFSRRLTFMKKTNKLYLKSSLSEKLLGIGYISNYGTDDISMKMVEMDFFDIFYRHGIVGFIIYISSLIYFLYKFIHIRLKLDNEVYIISIVFAFLLAFITGHVLIAPAVSIYVLLIIDQFYSKVSDNL